MSGKKVHIKGTKTTSFVGPCNAMIKIWSGLGITTWFWLGLIARVRISTLLVLVALCHHGDNSKHVRLGRDRGNETNVCWRQETNSSFLPSEVLK